MKQEIIVKEEVEKIIQHQLVDVIISKIENQKKFVFEIIQLQNDFKLNSSGNAPKETSFNEIISYKTDLSQKISIYFDSIQQQSFVNEFSEYYNSIDNYTLQLKEKIIKPQDVTRFNSLDTDPKWIRLLKTSKRNAFKISKLPLKFANGFRKVFRKPIKPIEYWKQIILLQNVTKHYYKSVLIKKLHPVINDVYSEIAATTKVVWKTDEELDQKIKNLIINNETFSISEINVKECLEGFDEIISTLKKKISKIFNETYKEYDEALSRSGTIELSNKNFKNQKIENEFSVAKKTVENLTKKWKNTFNILKDDWDLDAEIFILLSQIHIYYNDLLKSFDHKAKIIADEFDILYEHQQQSFNRIQNVSDSSLLKEGIINEIHEIKTHFTNQHLQNANQKIVNQELTLLLNNFEDSIETLISKVSKKRLISSDVDYTKALNASKVDRISPYELITYENWPTFKRKISDSKVIITASINEIIQSTMGLGQIAEFNLDSALTLLNETSKSSKKGKETALEGFQRNMDRISNLKNQVLLFNDDIDQKLNDPLAVFEKNILDFTRSENIFRIKLTIAKAKSIEKGKAYREKIKNSVIHAVPLALRYSRNKYTKVKNSVQGIMIRAGMLKSQHVTSDDNINFLLEAEKALDKLPFIYQRLFRSDTLQNESFFVGNEEKLAQLATSYTNWKKGRYATVLIIGEKGSGKTSLTHFFNQQNKPKNFDHITFDKTISDKTQFFDILNKHYLKELYTLEEWVDFFVKGKKRTVALENLHYLFYRKINGFELLHTLSELIVLTHKSVFWICTCLKFTYDYLEKSILFSEQFSAIIDVDNISSAIIIESIEKRHNISGYQLIFEEPPKEYLTKKYEKLSAAEKQNYLKAEFFKELIKIAKTNFKIAFMYWLRSTTNINGSIIHMRSLKNIDISFVQNLPPYQLFILHNILLHEKLKAKDISFLTGMSLTQTKLTLKAMQEDGVLNCEKNHYAINILLYRQVVEILKNQNFIH